MGNSGRAFNLLVSLKQDEVAFATMFAKAEANAFNGGAEQFKPQYCSVKKIEKKRLVIPRVNPRASAG
jgi:hypothetical protein